jgi:hypothetical protein
MTHVDGLPSVASGSGLSLGMLFAATLLVLPGGAHATAGFYCAADDAAARFSLAGAYARSIAGGIANFGGDAELKLKGIPDDARKLTFEASISARTGSRTVT